MSRPDPQTPEKLMQVVATIFAVTVLLDKRQRDQEMIEFTHAVMAINQRLRPGFILPRKNILSWYDSQKAELVKNLSDDQDNSWKQAILTEIRDESLRKMVLASIFAICICDYELRDEESDFIKTALNVWKCGLPTAADLESLAS